MRVIEAIVEIGNGWSLRLEKIDFSLDNDICIEEVRELLRNLSKFLIQVDYADISIRDKE